MSLKTKYLTLAIAAAGLGASQVRAEESIQGTYRAVLEHEPREQGADKFHQFATFTIRTVNPGSGNLKISANVKVFFGDWSSNEFLTYEYADVPLNLLTRQVSFKSESGDLSFVGILKNGEVSGEWFASAVGRVGKFKASKLQVPQAPADSDPVRTVTGHYLGLFENTNPNANLPERMSLSLVTTQDPGGLVISGNMRFYLGAFGSNEYVETRLKDVQFNFYTRYLTVRTEEHGITLKGTLSQNGVFEADVFADGFGRVGKARLEGAQ